MEIWILIAAAGSGYLAQYWHSSHKSEEAPFDIADDEDGDHPGSSSRARPSKRRYHRSLSSTRRRMEGIFNQNWHVSKFTQGVGMMTGGCARNLNEPVGDDKESHAAQAWHNWAIPDICNCSNMPTQFETRNATCSHSTYAIRSSHIPSKYPAPNTFNCLWPQKCCALDFSQGNHDSSGVLSEKVPSMLPEPFLDGGCCMSSLYFAHCTENSTMDEIGFKSQEGSPTKCIYEVFDNKNVNGEGQDHVGGSSSSTRKVRPHQSSGRSSKRRRSRAIGRPMTSSSSCLSVRLVDGYSQEVVEGYTHNSLACELPSRGLGQNLCKDEYNAEAFGICGKEAPRRECPAFLGGDDSELQGRSGINLMKLLLFNFGVGIGMMFAIMSNKHCTNLVFKPLEEALCLLKDLEREVQGRKKLRFEFYNTRKDSRENILSGQGHDAVKSLRRIIELVEQVRASFSNKDLTSEHPDSSLTMESATGKCAKSATSADYRHSKERARIEAELEAELEKMEMNLSIGDVSVLCPRRYSGVSEDDLEIGELVQGKLSIRGIPCDVEADSGDSDSSDECIHFGNCAVPPVELAKRLHEVLEARQDKDILELEAEVKRLDSRLQAKENEFQVWKQRAWHLMEDSAFEIDSGFEKGDCMKAADTTKKVLSSSTQERKHSFSAGMRNSAIVSPVCAVCEEPFSSKHTNEANFLHRRGPQPWICLGDEAYDEVCEEFFQLWSDTATETPSCSHNGLLKGAHPEREHVSCTSDATNDTLATCTLKAADKHTVAHHHHLEGKLKRKAEMEASSRKNCSNLECKGHLNLDRDGEVLPHLDNKPLSQVKPAMCAQDVIEIFESHGQFGRVLDWSMSEDSSYSSELDEQFGQLLIKRIIEKSKRGSSIVELAQSVMASLEIDETDMET